MRFLYAPFGIVFGVLGGLLGGMIFKQIWKRVADEDDAPSAMQSEYSLGQVLLAATIQGAIFAAVKALIDRGGAKGFQRLTGSWPGD